MSVEVADAEQAALRIVRALKPTAGVKHAESFSNHRCWVFVATEPSGALIMFAPPVFVDRQSGNAYLTATAFSIEELLAAYEALGEARFAHRDWLPYLNKRRSGRF